MGESDTSQTSTNLNGVRNCAELAEAILEAVADAVVLLDGNLRVVAANGEFQRLFRINEREMLGQPLFEVRTGNWDALRRVTQQVLKSGRPAEEQVTASLSGLARALNVTAVPLQGTGSADAHVVVAVTDISERERLLDERQEFEERYRTLVDTAQDGVWTIDASGNTTLANRAMARMLGTTVENMIGKPSFQYVFEEDVPKAAELFRSKVGGDREPFEFRLRREDGSWFWASVAGTPYHNARGETTGLLGTFRDVTERKLAEEAVSKHAHELARSAAALEQFAHVTSHDLREPLRTMKSYAQLLTRRYGGKLDRDADEFLGFIEGGAARMDKLISDLVAYCTAAERDGSVTTDVDLAKTVDWARKNLATRIADSAATIERRDLPVVPGDELQFVQMFQNLLSNAIKYRRPGERPRVEIAAELQNGQWLVSVRDNGIGIPEDKRNHVFGIFKRLHGPEVPGTGIGLAICRKIAENHGGRIWVESRVGEGSTFFFTIPETATPAS